MSKIERDLVMPSEEMASSIDKALQADGAVVVRHRHAFQDADEATVLAEAAKASMTLAEWARTDAVRQPSIDDLTGELTRVAGSYVHTPLLPLVVSLERVRDDIGTLLASGPHPAQARELFFLGGVACTLLAQATQNLGDSRSALQQALAAATLAEKADHSELRGWIAGTQALIAEWTGQHHRAIEHARRGASYLGGSPGQPRLAALEARAAARAGRAAEAYAALRRVESAAESSTGDLSGFGGILTFPQVKQVYYAGSTLTLLGDHANAEQAARLAISTYERCSPEDRSYGDLALAHVDVAFIQLARGDIDGAREALAPVVELPYEQRIRQVRDALHNLRLQLQAPALAAQQTAAELLTAIDAY